MGGKRTYITPHWSSLAPLALFCAVASIVFASAALFSGCNEPKALDSATRAPASLEASSSEHKALTLKVAAAENLSAYAPHIYHGTLPLLELELLHSLGSFLNLEVNIQRHPGSEEVISSLAKSSSGLASVLWSTAQPLPPGLTSAAELYEIPFVLACNEDDDSKKPLNVVYEEVALWDQEKLYLEEKSPQFSWQASVEYDTDELLEKVDHGQIDCTLTDATTLLIYQRHHPNIKKRPLPLSRKLMLVTTTNNPSLYQPIQSWMLELKSTQLLQKKIDTLFGYLSSVDSYETRVFIERINSRLDRYASLFKEAGRKYRIDWKLLAALSYQESHWNPFARSHTGVEGLMMLTSRTAQSLGVSDRLDPVQSVKAGALYLHQLLKRIPDHIPYPDRMWMALAAYNVGYAHVQDARALSVWKGDNPNQWSSLKTNLPLLTEKKYYQHLRFGSARGHEPVHFVERIRNYYEMLKWYYDEPLNTASLYE